MFCCCDRDSRVGDQYDNPRFKPPKPRRCTDVLSLFLFVAFWIFLLFLATYSFIVGNPMRLIRGSDSFGNICGTKNYPTPSSWGNERPDYQGLDMTDRPFVFYLNNNNLRKSMKLCVKQCPNDTLTDFGSLLVYTQKTGNNLCRYDFDLFREDYGYGLATDEHHQPLNSNTIRTYMNIDSNQGVGPCPTYPVFPSKSVLNRCIPMNLVTAGKNVAFSLYDYLNSFDTVKQIVGDVMISWREVLMMTGVAIILTFIVVFLIHFVADFVAWIFLVVVSLSLIALTGVMWWTYIDLKYDLNWNPKWGLNFLEENIRNEKTFLVLSIITTIVTIIMILICLVMRKRVKLVVALFYESASCIRAMPGLLFQPLWTFLTLSLFFIFWLAVLLALATADYPNKNETALKLKAKRPTFNAQEVSYGQADMASIKWINFNGTSWVKYMWWYLVIAFFWSTEFILGCQQMVIAGAVASWYFTRDRSNLPCPVGRSIRRLFLFHMGTVALGSFLITCFIIPRLIISYIEQKLKDYPDSAFARGMLRCCNCCLYMMESFLRYLNHNAYTVTAIEGTGFCTSAQIAFSTISSNALRVAAINSVGDFILFLGKCTVTVITAILATVLLKTNKDIHFFAVPIILIVIIAYFISHCVLSVYEMVIDTLFLCFCEDSNKNDGTPGREYFAPPSLLAFMTESSENEIAMETMNQNNKRNSQ